MINPNFSKINKEIAETSHKFYSSYSVWLTADCGSEWKEAEETHTLTSSLTHLLLGCLGSCLDGMSGLSVDKLSWSRRKTEEPLEIWWVENVDDETERRNHPLKHRLQPCESSILTLLLSLILSSLAWKTKVMVTVYHESTRGEMCSTFKIKKKKKGGGLHCLYQINTWANLLPHVPLTCC